jgi:hypothetical protein
MGPGLPWSAVPPRPRVLTAKQLAIAAPHPEADPRTVARRRRMVATLQRVMAERGLTPTAVAALLGVSRKHVYRLLDPFDMLVSIALVWRAERALGVDLPG